MQKDTNYIIYFKKIIAWLFFLGILHTCEAQNQELTLLRQQLKVAKDSFEYVNIWNRTGIVMHLKSPDSSFYYGIQGKLLADRLAYAKGQADALNNIGLGFEYQRLYSQALASYDQAMVIYTRLGDSSNIIQILINLSGVYYFLGDHEKEMQLNKKALAMGAHLSNDSIMSLVYYNYSFSNPALTKDSVNYFFTKAAQIADKYRDTRVSLAIKLFRASQLLDAGRTDTVRSVLLSAIDEAKAAQSAGLEIQGLTVYGNYLLQLNKADSAIYYYNQTLQLAIRNGFNYGEAQALARLLNAYKQTHNLQKQAETYELLLATSEREKDYLKNFMVDYTLYNAAQQNVVDLKTLDSDNQKKIIWLAALSAIGIIAAVAILRLYRNAQKYSRNLTALNQKITRQNDLLHQGDEFKAKLISMLAHDFKAPLLSTIQTVGLLRRNIGLEQKQSELFYNEIEAAATNVLYTFDNILDWVKKNYSGYVFTTQQFSVHYLADESYSMFATQMEEKKIQFNNLIPEEIVIRSDKEIVQFVSRNLIHNAIKFSPLRGTITINAKKEKNEVVVWVKDEGVGLSTEQMERLFTFTNSDTDTKVVNKGAGIALTICKEFIGILNGRIWVESKERKGTSFYFALPAHDNSPSDKV